MKYTKVLFITCICCMLFSCKTSREKNDVVQQEETTTTPVLISPFKKHYPEFSLLALQDSLKNTVRKTELSGLYQTGQYEPLWVKEDGISKVDSLLVFLDEAESYGLSPDYFRTSELRALSESVDAGEFEEQPSRLYETLVRIEALASQATIDYVTGLKFGFLEPSNIFTTNYYIKIARPDLYYYEALYNDMNHDLIALLSDCQISDPVYVGMREKLKTLQEKKDIEIKTIPLKKNKANYKLNEKSTAMPLIAKRLMLSGELPHSDHADSIYASLTPELLDAVNLFRRNNSYPEEKEVGKLTIEALNRPIRSDYEKVLANMERYRWKREKKHQGKYIEVNVAAFILQAIDQEEKPLVMNVCVGTVKNKTPMMEGDINYLNLNPAWNVPRSIAQKEIYFSIQKDSTYLQRNRMKLLQNGAEVDPKSIDWSSVDSKSFPYQIRQDSGDGNSLGRIKFSFNNPYAIYLHDTPSKRAFGYKNRAVSHGCVRVQKPADLAFFCLAEKDSVYFDRLLFSIDQAPLSAEGKKMKKSGQLKKLGNNVNINPNIPLFIDYRTVYMLPDTNQLFFADDIYKYDDVIVKALKQKELIRL